MLQIDILQKSNTMSYIVIHNFEIMKTMPTIPFTTRLDTELKARLEEIAQYEDRSASYVANRAIQNFVEEREATRALIEVGLNLAEREVSISESAIDSWLNSPEDTPFPKPDNVAQ